MWYWLRIATPAEAEISVAEFISYEALAMLVEVILELLPYLFTFG